jgi:SAM-dependent methyltransferase
MKPDSVANVASSRQKLNVYSYYTSQLMQRLGIQNIDFRLRLERKLQASPDRPIRILSLASGAARIEGQIISGLDAERIELTLTDINADLLAKAKARFAGKARVQTIALNVNQLSLPSNSYDIVICVSALHHVVELEHVMSQTAATLASDPVGARLHAQWRPSHRDVGHLPPQTIGRSEVRPSVGVSGVGTRWPYLTLTLVVGTPSTSRSHGSTLDTRPLGYLAALRYLSLAKNDLESSIVIQASEWG